MKYCSLLLKELSFNFEEINPCCSPYSSTSISYWKYSESDVIRDVQEKLNNIDLLKEKISLIDAINKAENSYCKNCIYLTEDSDLSNIDELKQYKYSSIYLRYWTKCNANCIYCDNIRDEKYGEGALYSPIPIIKKAYQNNLIDKDNLVIRFQGGDIGVLPEFEELVNLFTENGYYQIHFSTNNIIYQPKIEEILKAGKGSLNLSLDCGSDKTYKKIKRVDKFYDCINNLKKYIEMIGNSNNITVHYIIVKGYNDNKKEIKNFFKLMNDIGVLTVGIRIDHKDLNDYLLNNADIKVINKYRSLVTYFYRLANEYSIKLDNDICIEQNFVLGQKQEGLLNFIKEFFQR